MDDFIKTKATEDLWKEFKLKELLRAKKIIDKLITSYIEEGKTLEAFEKIWYSQTEDKKGENHIYNLAMSCSQSRKPFAGNSFEKSIKQLHLQNNIKTFDQIWVDKDGVVYDKKPKDKSVHKHDCLIPTTKDVKSISDMFVISKKTTLRERFRQDLDSVGKCKNVIFLTRETPTKSQIETICGYKCIIVYPYAENTEQTWSYEEYVSRMKKFQ